MTLLEIGLHINKVILMGRPGYQYGSETRYSIFHVNAKGNISMEISWVILDIILGFSYHTCRQDV